MSRDVVTGYCWPQSACPGDQVGLHMSSSSRAAGTRRGGTGRSAARGRVQSDGGRGRRTRNTRGCFLEGVRLAYCPHAGRRADMAVGLLRGRHGDLRWREGAARLRVLRRTSSPGTRIVVALATNTWHAYNDFGGSNLYTGGTHVAMQRPMSAGYLQKPPGKGRRVTGQASLIPRTPPTSATSRSIICRAMPVGGLA